jgi:hypothetical protein
VRACWSASACRSGGSVPILPKTSPNSMAITLPRRPVGVALMLPFFVVEAQPGTDPGPRLGDAGISVEVDLLVFQTAPQPLDEDIVHAAALPSMLIMMPPCSRTPVNSVLVNSVLVNSVLVNSVLVNSVVVNWHLVRVEDFGLTVPCQGLLKSLDAKVGAKRVRQPPRQHGAAYPIHNDHQVKKAPGHRDILAIAIYWPSGYR